MTKKGKMRKWLRNTFEIEKGKYIFGKLLNELKSQGEQRRGRGSVHVERGGEGDRGGGGSETGAGVWGVYECK